MKNYENARVFINKKLISVVLFIIAFQFLFNVSIENSNMQYLYKFNAKNYLSLYSEYINENGDENGKLYEGLFLLYNEELSKAEDPDYDNISEIENLCMQYPEAAEQYYKNKVEIDFNKNNLFYSIFKARSEKKEYLANYSDYINQVITKSNNMQEFSVFQSSSFSNKNIKKTIDDYNKSKNSFLENTNTTAFEKTVENEFSNYFSAIICVLFCIIAFYNKNTELEICMRSCKKGRVSLLINRIRTIALFTLLIVLIINLSNYFYYGFIYGFDINWFANVRSSMLFADFTCNINFAVSFMLILFIKFEMLFLLSLIVYFFLYKIKELSVLFIILSAFFVLEASLYKVIPIYSPFAFFRIVNIFFILDTSAVTEYNNIFLFGIAVKSEIVFVVFAGLLTLLMVLINIITLKNSYPIKSQNRIELKVNYLFRKAKFLINLIKNRIFSKHIEFYKFFFSQKMIVVVLIFAVIFINGFSFGNVQSEPVESYLESFYSDYGGKLNNNTLDRLNEIENEINNSQLKAAEYYNDFSAGKISEKEYNTKLSGIRSYEIEGKALNVLNDQIDYIKNEQSKDFDAYLISVKGYEQLCGINSISFDTNFMLYVVLILVLFTYSISICDKKRHIFVLLHSCKLGRTHLFLSKIKLLFGITGFLYLLATLYNFYYCYKYFDLQFLAAPLQSLETFAEFPIKISIISYIIIVNLIRLIMIFALESVMFYICIKINSQKALLFNSFLFVLPSVLELLGVELFYEFSAIHRLNFLINYIANNNYLYIYLIEFVVSIVMIPIFLILSNKNFSKTRSKYNET